MKSQLISAMGSFVLGTGATLVALASWLGTSDLQAIKESVTELDSRAEIQAQLFLESYTVAVDEANAEIGEYKTALEQANSNISQLITVYENKVTELEDANATYEQDLLDLQMELASMEDRLNAQYEADMNAIIEQANAQINQANEEVAETKDYVDEVLQNSNTNMPVQDRIADTGKVLDTEGDKTVTSIEGIIGEVVEGE
jgi:chromosome segregation ATPase